MLTPRGERRGSGHSYNATRAHSFSLHAPLRVYFAAQPPPPGYKRSHSSLIPPLPKTTRSIEPSEEGEVSRETARSAFLILILSLHAPPSLLWVSLTHIQSIRRGEIK